MDLWKEERTGRDTLKEERTEVGLVDLWKEEMTEV
jgi:hypothetical protein